LLAYNGQALNKMDDLKTVAEGSEPISIEVWRDGRSSRRDLAPGKLGAVIDPRPAPESIAANRTINKVLVAARGGDEDFAPLPGKRRDRGDDPSRGRLRRRSRVTYSFVPAAYGSGGRQGRTA
jgi:hypothetical protein